MSGASGSAKTGLKESTMSMSVDDGELERGKLAKMDGKKRGPLVFDVWPGRPVVEQLVHGLRVVVSQIPGEADGCPAEWPRSMSALETEMCVHLVSWSTSCNRHEVKLRRTWSGALGRIQQST